MERVRAGGWVLGFYGVAVLVAIAAAGAVPLPQVPERLAVFTQTFPLVIGAVVATLIAALARGGARAVGWPGTTLAVRGGVGGLALGTAMAAAALVVALVGGARWFPTGEPVGGYVTGLCAVVAGIAVAALGEELLFRGFPLATLANAFGRGTSVALLSLVFALMHLSNPSVTPFGLANILLASVVLSAAFFTRGALAAAWGLHTTWNGGLAVADAPVSGIRFDLPAFDFAPGTQSWITGGTFGPEGGVAATVALGGGLAWLAARIRHARPEGGP